MKKMLLVLCVVMLGSMLASAAAVTSYNVVSDSYCDIWNVNLTKGFNSFTGTAMPTKVYVYGSHDINTGGCDFGVWETVGQKHGASAKVPPNDLFGDAETVLDVTDGANGSVPTQFLLRVTHGCALAVYIGGAVFGISDNVFLNEDTCTLGTPTAPAPIRTGLKSIVPR